MGSAPLAVAGGVDAGSILSFMTDGSLPRLCERLSVLSGRRVTLHDADGSVVRSREGEPPFERSPWSPEGAETVVPLVAGEREIGSLRTPAGAGEEVRSALRLLAGTVGEVCESVLELRHRVQEMGALHRLTAHLARATAVEEVLSIALDSALSVLELDAGSIVLFSEDGEPDEDERGVELKTSRGLSAEWLADPRPLSVGREFDRRARSGEIVVVEDLRADPRVLEPSRVVRESLVGFVTCAMLVQDRPIGAIRLYSRGPRLLDRAEQRLVRSFAQQAGLAVEQARLLDLQAEDRKLQRQLALAADVQRRMLPSAMPKIAPFDVAARCVPSSELGGDFYDAFPVGKKDAPHLGLVIGDVVGKGMAAALLMASVRSSLRAFADEVYDIDEIVGRTNRALARDTLESEFVTLWYGVVDPARRHLTYCAAGHEPPLLVRVPGHRAPTTADVDELSTGGMVIGIDPSQRYQRGHFDLTPGDVLVCYTDGITDVRDFEERRFGKRRLIEAVLSTLGETPGATAGQVLEGVFWRIRQFAGLRGRPDDQTLLVVRVSG
jgi:sigma-B regulation protein RsbU (phosphoserine phosphatase)